jgi:hypothetical protein
MKTLKTLLFIMICTASYVGCSENQGISDNIEPVLIGRGEEPATNCKWKQATPVTPSNEQKNRLDNVFSGNNRLLGSIRIDTLIVINNQADMVKFQGFSEYPDLWMEFDWNNQSIIGGKISTPSVSDEILSRQLLECLSTSSFLYEIEVKKCTSCWTAIGHNYFWAIYARKLNTENVSLTIKTVE